VVQGLGPAWGLDMAWVLAREEPCLWVPGPLAGRHFGWQSRDVVSCSSSAAVVWELPAPEAAEPASALSIRMQPAATVRYLGAIWALLGAATGSCYWGALLG
jgi:hypothetical protein